MISITKKLACVFFLNLFVGSLYANPAETNPAETKFYEPVSRNIEGWKVAIDPSLLAAPHEKLGEEALKALANHLQRVRYIVPKDRLAELQTLRIWIDREHSLGNLQYHPSRVWLTKNGHDPRLEKHIHIPRAKQLLDPRQWAKHPYAILHELAHGFHDQMLGFDYGPIRDTFEQVRKDGSYLEVLVHTGRKAEHYALSNHKEYFAESTEAYFGVNDFYPFVRAELKEHDPRMFRLLKDIWGEVK
jgi:hypothetical protein